MNLEKNKVPRYRASQFSKNKKIASNLSIDQKKLLLNYFV